MSRVLGWLIGVDALLVLLCLALGHQAWLYSTQIGFVSASLVLGASMLSYSRMVHRRIADGAVVAEDDRDDLDKMEDPYDLYGDEAATADAPNLKETIRAEKQQMKQQRRSLYQTLRDSRASLSFMRLGAYLFLFAGFFYLNKNQLLHIPSYLTALSLPIIVIVGLLLTHKTDSPQETQL